MDAHQWDERYSQAALLWTAEPNRFLVDEVASLAPKAALDVACGEGRNSVWLAERGWTVTGVDFSKVALDKGRQLAEARNVPVTFELADATFYTRLDAFDLVIVMYLQLPAPARRSAFGNAAAAVRSGGTLLIVGHDITNIADGYGGPQDPSVLYGPDDVTRDIAGLDIVKAERVLRPVATDDGTRNAIDVLVRASRS